MFLHRHDLKKGLKLLPCIAFVNWEQDDIVLVVGTSGSFSFVQAIRKPEV